MDICSDRKPRILEILENEAFWSRGNLEIKENKQFWPPGSLEILENAPVWAPGNMEILEHAPFWSLVNLKILEHEPYWPVLVEQIQGCGVTVAATAAATSQGLSQSGKSPGPSRMGTKYPVGESLTSIINVHLCLHLDLDSLHKCSVQVCRQPVVRMGSPIQLKWFLSNQGACT